MTSWVSLSSAAASAAFRASSRMNAARPVDVAPEIGHVKLQLTGVQLEQPSPAVERL
jgi:hypothetical protein